MALCQNCSRRLEEGDLRCSGCGEVPIHYDAQRALDSTSAPDGDVPPEKQARNLFVCGVLLCSMAISMPLLEAASGRQVVYVSLIAAAGGPASLYGALIYALFGRRASALGSSRRPTPLGLVVFVLPATVIGIYTAMYVASLGRSVR